MIQKVTVTNHLGEKVVMEMRNPEKSGFLIRKIDGLTPPKADIDTTEVSAIDGSSYNSARANSRNIVFTLGLLENPTVEDSRQNSYKYFPLKKRVDILIETDKRTCRTYGYVESNEPDIFNSQEDTVISVKCPDSYLYSTELAETVFSSATPSFQFPFSNESTVSPMIMFGSLDVHFTKSVYYTGEAATGIILYIHATGQVTNVNIMNVRTREAINIFSDRLIALTGEDIHEGDDIIISTVKGDKYAKLLRDGQIFNIRNAIDKYPDWFQIEKGDNIFTYMADDGGTNLQFRVENIVAYEGI